MNVNVKVSVNLKHRTRRPTVPVNEEALSQHFNANEFKSTGTRWRHFTTTSFPLKLL